MAQHYQLTNVTFHGFKPEKDIPKYLSSSDMALLILKPNPVFEMTIPAKLQTYLACGIPIIGCVSGEGKRIIEESQSGLISNEISINGLKDICLKALNFQKQEIQEFGQNAFIYGQKNFDKHLLLNKLDMYMEELNNESI